MAETCPLAHFVGLGRTTSQLTFVQHHAWPILLGMALLMQCLHPCLVCPHPVLQGGGLLVCRCTSGLNLNQGIVQQDCPDLLLFFCSFCKPYRTTHSRAISNRGGCERHSLLSLENMTHRCLLCIMACWLLQLFSEKHLAPLSLCCHRTFVLSLMALCAHTSAAADMVCPNHVLSEFFSFVFFCSQ